MATTTETSSRYETQRAALIQDAFHYAIMAAGGTWGGLQSSFDGLGSPKRGESMKSALTKAKAAFGVSLASQAYAGGRTLAHAERLCAVILELAKQYDTDANSGERLCPVCRDDGAEGALGGLCYGCYDRAQAEAKTAKQAAEAAKPTQLQAGTYALTRDVTNPSPDRRVKRDWRAEPEWTAGQRFYLRAYGTTGSFDVRRTDAAWESMCLDVNAEQLSPNVQALIAALEPVEEQPSDHLKRNGRSKLASEILDILLAEGVVGWDDIKSAEESIIRRWQES